MLLEMSGAFDFIMELRDQVYGPHRTWLANPTLSKLIVPTGFLSLRDRAAPQVVTKYGPFILSHTEARCAISSAVA